MPTDPAMTFQPSIQPYKNSRAGLFRLSVSSGGADSSVPTGQYPDNIKDAPCPVLYGTSCTSGRRSSLNAAPVLHTRHQPPIVRAVEVGPGVTAVCIEAGVVESGLWRTAPNPGEYPAFFPRQRPASCGPLFLLVTQLNQGFQFIHVNTVPAGSARTPLFFAAYIVCLS